jgi:hypothetical protein
MTAKMAPKPYTYPTKEERYVWSESIAALAPVYAYCDRGWHKTWTTSDSMWWLEIDSEMMRVEVKGSRGSYTFHKPSAEYIRTLLVHLGALE